MDWVQRLVKNPKYVITYFVHMDCYSDIVEFGDCDSLNVLASLPTCTGCYNNGMIVIV